MLLVTLSEDAYRESGRYDAESALTVAAGRRFRNEVVPLEGHAYTGCDFTNVNLVFRGEAHYVLSGNTFNGELHIDIRSSPSLTCLVQLQQEFDLRWPGLMIFDEPAV